MKLLRWMAIGLTTFSLSAAVPPPPQLFPEDTLLLLTVPNWTAMHQSAESAPLGRLWADPAMKPFRDKFETQFREEFLGTLEKDLGLKAADFLPLLQGQVSVAAIKAAWDPSDEESDPTFVAVVDAKDKADQLKARLTEIRQKLNDAKKPLKTEKIRDFEFTTVKIERAASEDGDGDADPDDADADADAGSDGEAEPNEFELTFGQVDSALVVASSTAGLDRVVARLSGGTAPILGDTPDFQAAEAGGAFREATAYGYLHAGALIEAFAAEAGSEGPEGGMFGVDPKQVMTGLGLDGLRSGSVSVRQADAGLFGRTLIAIPAAKRTGIFKLLEFEGKDASPPTFVPADVVAFARFRLNGQKIWSGVEAMVQQISPQMGGLLTMSLGALGKDKDPNFDFRKQFFGNLGDDFVSYERAPRGKTLAELQNQPSLSLLGAVNATEMLSAMRMLASLLPSGGDDIKEREVSGKKIYSIKLPSMPDQPARTIEFAASGGYVAFANDAAILEEYLRSSDGGGRSLKEVPTIAEAAQQVGGMTTGFFTYQNQRESMQTTWEVLRTSGSLEELAPGMTKATVEEASDWLDFSLLPPFEQIAKYFGIAVTAGAWDSAGFQMKTFAPTPK